MKRITFALLVFCIFACGEKECIDIELSTPTEIVNEDLVCIDGTEYTIFARDQRCACGATCIWEGEFTITFEDSEGVNAYTYHQVDTTSNLVPPFAESIRLTDFFGHGECGDDSKIEDVTFVIQID